MHRVIFSPPLLRWVWSSMGSADDNVRHAHTHAVTSTHTVLPPQILVEVRSLLIAFQAVDGQITVREEAGKCQEDEKRPSPTYTHTHSHKRDVNTPKQRHRQSQHAHKHIHNLARTSANRDCYQLISASSCRGQPYWHCNDGSLLWVAPSAVRPCHSDSIINTQTPG